MKKVIVIIFLSFSFLGFSQKIKLKKEEILVDDNTWLKYDGCKGSKYQLCSIYNLEGEELVFLKFIKQSSDNLVFNKYGDPNYYLVSFLGLEKKVEIRELPVKIIKIIYNSKIINEDGTLNEENVDRMVEKYGSSYSSNN